MTVTPPAGHHDAARADVTGVAIDRVGEKNIQQDLTVLVRSRLQPDGTARPGAGRSLNSAESELNCAVSR